MFSPKSNAAIASFTSVLIAMMLSGAACSDENEEPIELDWDSAITPDVGGDTSPAPDTAQPELDAGDTSPAPDTAQPELDAVIDVRDEPDDTGQGSCPVAAPTTCNGECVDTSTSPAHCGGCDRPCDADQDCVASVCVSSGSCVTEGCSGMTWCNPSTGACEEGCDEGGEQCDQTEVCELTTRTCECREGSHRCDGVCVDSAQIATCGDRCEPCPGDPMGTATCVEGVCGLECGPGYEICADQCCAEAPRERLDVVDPGGYARTGSLAVDSTDRAHLAFGTFERYLSYARWSGSQWTVEVVDDAVSVAGSAAPMVLDGLDRPHIIYLDWTNPALKYATFDGTDWLIETVDNVGEIFAQLSVAIDSSGGLHVAYNRRGDIFYVRRTSMGWQGPVLVARTGSQGFGVSLAIDSTDAPALVFNTQIANGEVPRGLLYANLDGGAWSLSRIEVADEGYEFHQLHFDSMDRPHLATYGSRSENLIYRIRYYHRASDQWTSDLVDDDVGFAANLGLELTPSDEPMIVYRHVAQQETKIALLSGGVWNFTTIPLPCIAGDCGSWGHSIAQDGQGGLHVLLNSNQGLRYYYRP